MGGLCNSHQLNRPISSNVYFRMHGMRQAQPQGWTHTEGRGLRSLHEQCVTSMGTNVIEDRQIDSEKLNATVIALAIRLAFLGLLLFLSLSIIRPFIETVAWGVVWAVALYPVFDLLARWLGGRRRLAAALITILLLLIVIGPVTWLGLDLVDVPRMIYARLDSGNL